MPCNILPMGSKLHGIFLCQAFCSAAFMTPSSRLAKTTASTNAEVSAIGPAYMTPSIPKKIGKTTISGSRKSTCLVRDMITPSLAFPMEVKKAGGHRLDSVGKGHQHEDAEIFFCKMKVQVAAVSEDAYDLMWEELEADKKYGCDHST